VAGFERVRQIWQRMQKEHSMAFTDMIGAPIHIVSGAANVADRPETSAITKVEFSPQSFYVRHTKEASWPQPIPPGWEGGVQFTHWIVLSVNQQWMAVPTIECWKTAPDDPFSGTWKGGAPAPFSTGSREWWYYAPEVAQKQPHQGELIGVFVSAGSQRQKDVTDPNCIERSNIVWVNVPSADSGVFTFDGGTVPPQPQPPTTGLPGYDEAKSIQFGTMCNETYQECGAAMDPGMISVHSMRAAFDYYQGHLDWPTSFAKHTNEFRAVYSLPPI
jgi:hypothetical protein